MLLSAMLLWHLWNKMGKTMFICRFAQQWTTCRFGQGYNTYSLPLNPKRPAISLPHQNHPVKLPESYLSHRNFFFLRKQPETYPKLAEEPKNWWDTLKHSDALLKEQLKDLALHWHYHSYSWCQRLYNPLFLCVFLDTSKDSYCSETKLEEEEMNIVFSTMILHTFTWI